MPTYTAPADNVLFLLRDVLGYEKYSNLAGFSEAPLDVLEAVVREAARLCEEVMQPLNEVGDREGVTRLPDGSVRTPKGFKEAYAAYAAGGWSGVAIPAEHGGQGLPGVVGAALGEFMASSNQGFANYPGLSAGAALAIIKHATPEQMAVFQKAYLPKLVDGTWTGTMNLTEAHCGTDLGLIRTRAARQADGSYRITGSKIFITGGEHDLTENIVHLVLARVEGAPAGVRGISLFLVPKFIADDGGKPGQRNAVSCGKVEEKMGIHGSATCVMNYDGATGWLVGEENKGLTGMFVMMNEARLNVGISGLAMSEVAYQNAASYAKERLQGRALAGPEHPDQPADPIIVHPDVRRMLMTIRAFNEAARGVALWTALTNDVARRSPDEKERQAAEDHVALLTPVIKGVFTDMGFANAVMAQQIYGGHGYITETGVEQFVRDARISMIYEGANGIQALDLVGRKLPRDNGRAVLAFFNELGGFLKENAEDAALAPLLKSLKTAMGHLEQATTWFVTNALGKRDPYAAAAGSYDYMHLFGLVVLGYMWCRIAKVAGAKAAEGNGAAEPMKHKLVLARYFMERMLPETGARLAAVTAGPEALMALPEEAF
ncbi:MAG TPA: acyl-CoA dehydrogenase C-terminal domain-containing protein [Hyphomicrobiales bacterium]|nr:acyl-CoA dehydrogenase C-terminal domain-containing protein [Hyphomicrobiales bacterium]